MWFLLGVIHEIAVGCQLESLVIQRFDWSGDPSLREGLAADTASRWELFGMVYWRTSMHDLSMWLGLLTTLKMDFDRDLPIRDIP